jgi:RNA polymerase sigma factor (sigma-70 family)
VITSSGPVSIFGTGALTKPKKLDATEEFAVAAQFGSTCWSLVLAVAGNKSAAKNALESLCQSYVRRRTTSVHDAQDLTQAFFTYLLEKNALQAADPQRGRFRAFLVTALKNFLANEHDRATAQKRGGGRIIVPLDMDLAENQVRDDLRTERTPDHIFERQWALALLERVIQRLESEYTTAGKERQFSELRFYLTGQNTGQKQKQVAVRLKSSEQAVRAAIYRLRKRYRELLLHEIAQTVTSPDQLEEELNQLFQALAN